MLQTSAQLKNCSSTLKENMAEEAVLAISEYLVDTGIATYGITAAEAAYIVAAIEIVAPIVSDQHLQRCASGGRVMVLS
jgi:nucleoid-associated protein YgaU